MKTKTETNTKISEKGNHHELIRHLEIIAIKAKDCGGNLEHIEIPTDSIKIACGFFGLTSLQTILFSVVFVLSFENNTVNIGDISKYFDCNNLTVVKFITDFDAIEKKKLIRHDYGGSRLYKPKFPTLHDFSFTISANVLNAILAGNMDALRPKTDFDLVSFLEAIHSLIEEREDGNITYQELSNETDLIMEENKNIPFIRKVNSFVLNEDDKILLLYLCRETMNGSLEVDLSSTFEKIYEDPSTRFRMRNRLVKEYSSLNSFNLVKLIDGSFRNDRDIMLTDHAIELLFPEDVNVIRHNNASKHLIPFSDINPTKLHFDDEINQQLRQLSNILDADNYITIKDRLANKNMPTGISILFHGDPGTGKTATVFQQALQIKRNIMMVDISATKSMWFGESERIIGQIFMDYNLLVKNEKVTPILLFNECDAVFSTRKEIGSNPVGQTENAIQNIILQQMENMEGILIATTNLTQNLDPAFERRFLYKVKFSKPSLKVRSRIWKSKIKMLTGTQALKLAEDFDFTGGNIENIARKVTMTEVIDGRKPKFEEIKDFCKNEILLTHKQPKVGFNV